MSNAELKEEIGLLVDKCENFIAASQLPMPDSIHAQAMREGLKEIVIRLMHIESNLP